MTEEEYSEVNYKSICCEQIPELFLDRFIAKKHFSKFGKINRFIHRPKRLSCTVEYENEADAERAVEEAGFFNGQQFPVHFAEREVGHVQNTEEWVDADVQSELDAMGGQNQVRQMNPAIANRMFSVPTKRNSPQRLAPKCSETPPAIAPKIDGALRSELENLLRQPAYSAEERYRVLDARDKLIRLTSVKQTDIAKAEKRKGTCPDMCPEKERLMRDFQRQVSIFEANKSSMIGSISHRHAIKEYSRSSADQEVPLSHELRPANVLKMTMLYLMYRIMDQLDTTQVNVSDWFHFVWDRTRSIRKDITQQELCSLDAVELVEQCARFHIHCAARLVAEDPSVFDKKINAENLTKCLQTLKYLYHDLRLKNIPCPREAEFRGYIVLLNLGNSNFLWEVKQLPDHIQQSKEIKRAMTFYNVLQNNNYVRFFNMIREKETSYLSACILLGYFTQLRLRACNAIVKSHNWRKNSIFMPLNYLTKILGFEDEQAAAQFFQFHGLVCDDDRGVLLDKPQPAVDYCMERALKLVESKRTVSVGECICGHSLESADIFEKHQPHNSFDDNGILKPEAWNAEDQLRGDAAIAKTKETVTQEEIRTTPMNKLENIFKVPQISPTLPIKQPPQLPLPSKAPKTGFSIFLPKESPSSNFTSNSIFNVSKTKSENSGGNLFSRSDQSKTTTITEGSSIFGTIPKSSVTDASVKRENPLCFSFQPTVEKVSEDEKVKENAKAAAEAKRQREKELEKAEHERKAAEVAAAKLAADKHKQKVANLERCAIRECDTFVSGVVTEEISEIAKAELDLYHSLETRAKELTEELFNELVSEKTREIATAEYNIHCHDHMLLERYFNIWLRTTRKKISQRKLLESTPMWITIDTREEQSKKLQHPSQMYNMHMIKRYRHGQPCDFRKLLWDEESEKTCRHAIDIGKMISKYLSFKMPVEHIQQRKYFKLLFSLPEEMDEIPGIKSLYNKWLQHVLRFPKNNDDSQSYICALQDNVALCVRKVSGVKPINECGKSVQHPECDNLDGIVFFMTCSDLCSTRRRLHCLLQHTRNHKRVPIAFVVHSNFEYDTQEIAVALDLKSLLDRELLCGFKIYSSTHKTENIFKASLEQALLFAIHTSLQKNSKDNNLRMETTQDWFETCLGEEMWRRWQATELQNPAFRKVCSILEHVIDLYNSAVDRLQKILNEKWENEPDFPTELKQFVPELKEASIPLTLEYFPVNWKSFERQQLLLNFLQKIKLPKSKNSVPSDIKDLKMWLLNFASLCITNEKVSTEAAYYAIKTLVQQLVADDLQTIDIKERINLISFLPVIKPIVFAHINEQLQKNALPAEIIYRHEPLQKYLEYPWWLTLEAVKVVTFKFNNKNSLMQQESIKIQDPMEEFNAVLKRAAEVSQLFEQKISAKKRKSPDDNVKISLLHQLDQTIHDFEAAKAAGIYEIEMSIPNTKKKYSRKSKENVEHQDSKEQLSKERNVNPPMSANEIISHALSVIEKSNASKDAKVKLDYTMSRLNL